MCVYTYVCVNIYVFMCVYMDLIYIDKDPGGVRLVWSWRPLLRVITKVQQQEYK